MNALRSLGAGLVLAAVVVAGASTEEDRPVRDHGEPGPVALLPGP